MSQGTALSGLKSVKPWWALALCLALFTLFVVRPIGVDPPGQLKTEFDTARAIDRLKIILGDERPHPIDTEANDAVRERLLLQIRQLGFTPEVRDRFHCNDIRPGAAICARPRNVVFWVTPPGKNAVMLMSHYDSVAAGPGAADDGMGVAISLEVARLLKDKKLARPVLVLITDGEEAGLIGAAAFATHDPLKAQIGAVVNLEARGTTGTANMFQTSSPNAHDIAALERGGLVASANALATDFYKLLPNDSDLTMLLPMKVDAANFAIVSAGKRYHTPLDNLAHLDPRSVQQMGASALNSVTGFASAGSNSDEGQRVFTNVGRTFFVTLPNGAALAILIAGLAAGAVLFARAPGQTPVRTALAPLVAIIAGTGLAFGMGMVLALLRSETAFGTAYPAAARAVYGAAALFGASIVIYLMKAQGGTRLAAAAWIWLTALILAAFAFVPGLSIIVVWPVIFVIAAALVSWSPRLRTGAPWLMAIAPVAYMLIALPLAGGLEEGLFVEHAAPSAFLLVFMFLFCMPAAGPKFWVAPLASGAILVIAFAAALSVPAYTRDAPRHLNVVHEDVDGKASFVLQDKARPPEAMLAAATFDKTPDDKGFWRAPAPRIDDDSTLQVVSTPRADGSRLIELRIGAPQADRHDFLIKKGDGIRNLVVNGTRSVIKGPLTYAGCSGRTCRTLDIAFELPVKAPVPEITWRQVRFGAGPAAQKLVAARPDTAQPVHTGDQRTIVRTVKLNGGNK